MQVVPERLTLAEAGEEGSAPNLRVTNLGHLPYSSWTASSWWAPSRTASI